MLKSENNLETNRLVLEPLRREHAERLFAKLSDQRIYSFIPKDAPTSLQMLEARCQKLETRKSPAGDQLWLNWAIRLKVQNEYIGTVQATVRENNNANIAYELTPDYWRQGYATEACLRIIECLFADYRLTEIFAEVDTRNAASWRLLEKLGFERTMTQLNADYFKGAQSDEYTYRLACGNDAT